MSNEELIDVAGLHMDLDADGDDDLIDMLVPRDADDVDQVEFGNDPGERLLTRLKARAPFRVSKMVVALAGLFIVLVGFIGGVLVEKKYGGGTATDNGGSFAGPLPSGFTFGSGSGSGSGGGGAPAASAAAAGTTGTVTVVDGTTLYVTTSTGEVVIVKTNGSTSVKAQAAGAVKDLKVGDAVTVTGTTGSDGSVTATQIAKNP